MVGWAMVGLNQMLRVTGFCSFLAKSVFKILALTRRQVSWRGLNTIIQNLSCLNTNSLTFSRVESEIFGHPKYIHVYFFIFLDYCILYCLYAIIFKYTTVWGGP